MADYYQISFQLSGQLFVCVHINRWVCLGDETGNAEATEIPASLLTTENWQNIFDLLTGLISNAAICQPKVVSAEEIGTKSVQTSKTHRDTLKSYGRSSTFSVTFPSFSVCTFEAIDWRGKGNASASQMFDYQWEGRERKQNASNAFPSSPLPLWNPLGYFSACGGDGGPLLKK